MEKILINEESLAKKSDVHFLPCKISYDGKANVKSFFTSSILHSDDSKVIESSLRGRPLHGINLKLADNQIGLVVADKTESGKRELKLESTFDHISSWQLDEPEISQNTEPLCRAINEWFAVSEIIHSD